jgi:N-methylhydantoinase A/acetophenone carboxylase
MFTFGMDTGSTFTDGFATDGTRVAAVKVSTTPHDLTVCFMECLEAAAAQLGLDVHSFLDQTEAIRYSTTVGTNTILERRGPKIGLLATAGHAARLLGEDADGRANVVTAGLINPEMIVGVREETNEGGDVVEPVRDDEVRPAIEDLLMKGARVICVSFANSHLSPVNERAVKHILQQEYPPQYLGSVPVLLASSLSRRPALMARTNLAVLGSYIHQAMIRYLYKAEDEARLKGYAHPLLVVHSTGGVARVAKTAAVHTLNSGPVAGLAGASAFAKRLGIDRLLTMDVGGTSIDLSLIVDGRAVTSDQPQIDVLPVDVTLPEIINLPGGGSSILRVDQETRTLSVGPESAGALPGPACFDLGGAEPTLLDADVVLGHVDASLFHGGRRPLKPERSWQAIKDKTAHPLGVDVEGAALMATKESARRVVDDTTVFLDRLGESGGSLTMLAYGGGGGLRACDVASALGIGRIYHPLYSSVFSALGASTLDVSHNYERIVRTTGADVDDPGDDELQAAVAELRERAAKDMRGEQVDVDRVQYATEVELLPGMRSNGPSMALLSLRAWAPRDGFSLPVHEHAGTDAEGAVRTVRDVYWGAAGREPTKVYTRSLLKHGNEILGPALIEEEETVCRLPHGWRYVVDEHLHGRLDRSG